MVSCFVCHLQINRKKYKQFVGLEQYIQFVRTLDSEQFMN